MNGGDEDGQLPGEPLWRPPAGKPYDWKRERWGSWPRSIDWEEVVVVVLGIIAVLFAAWLMTAFVD